VVKFTLQSRCLRTKIFRTVGIKEKCLEFCPNFGYEIVMKRGRVCKQRQACFGVDYMYMLVKERKKARYIILSFIRGNGGEGVHGRLRNTSNTKHIF